MGLHRTPRTGVQSVKTRPSEGHRDTASGWTSTATSTYPLGPAQRRIWFLHRYDEDGASYNIARASRMRGQLDLDLLRRSFEVVADRHEILRTRYPERDGTPVQMIEPPGSIDFMEADFSSLSTSERESRLDAYLTDEAQGPFDLASGPVWKVRIVKLEPDHHVVLTVIHHIAADGWSFPQLRSEIGVIYRSLASGASIDLPPLPIQYRDIAQREIAAASAIPSDVANFWLEKLGDDPDPLPLRSDRARSRQRTSHGGWIDFSVSNTSEESLRLSAVNLDASPFMVTLALFAGFLARQTGTLEVIVGIPSAERNSRESQALIGPLINTLPIRLSVGQETTLRDLVASTRAEVLAALDHAIAFEEIVRLSVPRREPSHTPLFQVMFQYRDGSFRTGHDLPNVVEEVVRIKSSTSKFDLILEVGGGDPLAGALNYSSDLFDHETAERLASAFAVMSAAAIAQPDLPLNRLPLVEPWERDWLVHDVNQTARPIPSATIAELYDQVVADHPHLLAVEHGELRLTHRELLDGARAIARTLSEAGVGHGHPVGVRLPRSALMIAAEIAILQLGAVYVPLDPSYPADRIQHMIETAGIGWVIGRPPGSRWNEVELIASGIQPRPLDVAHRPAYVMFTSGSTGTPKGVVIPERAIIRLVRNTDFVELGPGDVIAHLSNVSFDAATFEVWGALLNGAAIAIFDTDTVLDPTEFARSLTDRSVSTLFVTTALFNTVARHAPAAFASVKNVLFGGERCDPGAVRTILEAGAPERLIHVYGPTETTTFATWHLVKGVPYDAVSVPIGSPIANTTAYILDPAGGLLPQGLVGELYIGGPGLAVGYLNEPDFDHAKFAPNPFTDDPAGRLYRTGDLVRRLSDGQIEFVGRSDRQLKVRGFRIEPAEVEEALIRLPHVAAAFVGITEARGVSQLTAWVVPREEALADPSRLRGQLESSLPAFMVPSLISIVPALPIGPHGKVDPSRLPAPAPKATTQSVVATTGSEERMVGIFRRVLGVSEVGGSDSFFDLGGHSLMAVELIANIDREFGVRLPLSTLFTSPSPSSLAARVEDGDTGPLESGLVVLQEGGPHSPVFIFHHPSGTVLAYEPLARHLGDDQLVYGIQARGVDGSTRPFASIKAMAFDYADLIERTDPSGSYRLVGHSIGGLLAWETARELNRRGHQVAFLALLDSLFPDRRWFRSGVIDGNPASAGTMMLREARRALGDVRWGVRWALYGATRKTLPPGEARLRLIRASSRAFDRYRPQRFRGRVIYIEAAENKAVIGTKVEEWGRLCDELEIVTVPGAHSGPDSILGPRHVEVVGIELRKRLEALAAVQGRVA